MRPLLDGTRRLLVLALLGGCLHALAASAGGSASSRWQEPFFFLVMADPQLGMTTRGRSVEAEATLLTQAVAHANRLRPAFIVICGDLINRPGDDTQAAAFKRVLAALDPEIPVHLAAGNHDVRSNPRPDDLRWYRSSFGPDWYSFEHGGVHFTVLNSCIIRSPDLVRRDYRAQQRWLKADLRAARDSVHTIVFQHHSLFLRSPDEPGHNFNFPPRPRRLYLDLLERKGVDAVFSGHYHRSSYGTYRAMEVITGGPVGPGRKGSPSGFTIVEVYRDRLRHHFRAFDQMPERVVMIRDRPQAPAAGRRGGTSN